MDDFLRKLTRGPKGAMALGSFLTLVVFGFLSALLGVGQSFGIFGVIGTAALGIAAFAWGFGPFGTRFKFIRERVEKITATVLVAGDDDEHVDRSAITIRVMAERHGLKVDLDKRIKPDSTPPELVHLNLKFRALLVHGPLRKMRAFSIEAEAYLKTIGMGATITGTAVDDVMGKKED